MHQSNCKGNTGETHPLFELLSLLNGHRVRLGNDRDDIDRVTQALHELSVQLAEAEKDGSDETERTSSQQAD